MAHNKSEPHNHNVTQPASSLQLTDPVCGMPVTKDSVNQVQHEGKRFYFCSTKCSETFKRDPKKFTGQKNKNEAAFEQVAPGTIYTCPMHPEIRQDRRGNCP